MTGLTRSLIMTAHLTIAAMICLLVGAAPLTQQEASAAKPGVKAQQVTRDRALLEQDQGNRFSARIFPIEANATVRLVLSYSALLPLEDGVRRYTLPLRGVPKVNHLTFRAFVSALPGEEGPGSAKSNVTG